MTKINNPNAENEAAVRRGKRIEEMRKGLPISSPELAEYDARIGNADDLAVLSLVRGQKIAQARIEMQKGLEAQPKKNSKILTPPHIAHFYNEQQAANEACETMLAIGPTCYR
ncbi:MAG: hypothetical protein ABIR24_12855 [Verrucomicrobiota bacterium]